MPKAINELKAKYEDDIGQLNKKIVELQLRLDDRERRRREHEEEVRVKNERINNIAGLIATGNVIAKSFEEKNDKDLVKEQYLEWDALESLASGTFGVTYLAPFGSAKGTGTSLMNHKIPGVNASHSETVRHCPALNQREHNGGASCAAPPPNSGKNHYLKRLNHASRSAPYIHGRLPRVATDAYHTTRARARYPAKLSSNRAIGRK
jgi:hypothetical protein